MNTGTEWDVPKPLDGEVLSHTPTSTERSAAQLESDLQAERDSRKEERFYWIAALVIVGNVPIFNAFSSAWALLPTFLLELIVLIGLADWLGVDRVKVLLERLYSRFHNGDKGA
ncbi:hypothetical protein RA2_01243 [Roseovarius sp. A-2]|nr:hypothetical protein RA2_01243 [Roseovarius sp. A-2]